MLAMQTVCRPSIVATRDNGHEILSVLHRSHDSQVCSRLRRLLRSTPTQLCVSIYYECMDEVRFTHACTLG